jgi:signal transduction histidine kinase
MPQRLIGAEHALDSRVLDAAVAVGLTGWAFAEPGTLSDFPRPLALIAMTVAIAWCRTWPTTVLALEVVGIVLLAGDLKWPQGVAVLIAAYSAAFYSDRRWVVAALLVAASACLWSFDKTVRIPSGLVPLVLLAPVWVGGTAMRRREQRAEASATRAARLEREREMALRAERARIARELHDLVTHSVSVMVLQTGAARQIMTKDSRRSRAILESVEASGRSALEELRHMLGLLAERDADAPLTPQPGITEIPALVDQVREAGIAVELWVEGEPRELPRGLAIAAYRIVQEALTNVIKHADGAPSHVILRWSDTTLELEIIDDGAPHDGGSPDAPIGRGITGMRERAVMYRGTLEAGPRPGRGYEVHARIPLEVTRA